MKGKERLCIYLLKYVPVICAVLMLGHVILLVIGKNLCLSELAVLTLVSAMVLYWSHIFKFCLVHKLSILYTLSILWCCDIERFIGFGIYLQLLRVSTIYIGIILLILLVIKHAEHYKKIIRRHHR